jgi:hypothetical protein
MIDKLMKFLLDFVYRTKKKAKQYLKDNPTETIIAIDVAKGIFTENVQYFDYGDEWEYAKSATIILTNKKIVFNNYRDNCQWVILIEDVTIAKLNSFINGFGYFQVLRIEVKNGESYQFGMQLNNEWTQQTTLPLELEKHGLTHFKLAIIHLILWISVLLIYFLNYLWIH